MGAWVVWIFVCCRYWEENKVHRWSKERLEPKTLGDYPKKKRNTSRNHKEDPKPNEDGAKQEDLKLLTLLFVKEVIRLLVPSFLLTFNSQKVENPQYCTWLIKRLGWIRPPTLCVFLLPFGEEPCIVLSFWLLGCLE